MSSLPRRSPHCHPPFCHLEDPVEAHRKTVPQSSPAKKKIVEFLVTYGMQLLIVALFMFMVVVEVVEGVREHIEVVEVTPTIR